MSAVLSWAGEHDGLPAQSFAHSSRSRPRRSAPGELPPEVEQALWRGSDLGHASGSVVLQRLRGAGRRTARWRLAPPIADRNPDARSRRRWSGACSGRRCAGSSPPAARWWWSARRSRRTCRACATRASTSATGLGAGRHAGRAPVVHRAAHQGQRLRCARGRGCRRRGPSRCAGCRSARRAAKAPVFLCRPGSARASRRPRRCALQAPVGLDWELQVQRVQAPGPPLDETLRLPSVPGGLQAVLTPRLRQPSRSDAHAKRPTMLWSACSCPPRPPTQHAAAH